MKNKICLILPYFGKFPNYFDKFLYSISSSKIVDLFIITDNKIIIDYNNINIINEEFYDIQKRINTKLSTYFDNKKLILNKPYKLCDYKPFYNFIFEDFISNYSYWGYCDCDLIFGNVDYFLNKINYKNYDVIGSLGHLSIFKNIQNVNSVVLKDLNSLYDMLNNNQRIYGLDESKYCRYNLCNLNKIDINDLISDIVFWKSCLNPVKSINTKCVYMFKKNSLFEYDLYSTKMIEVLYVHLQKRKMKIKENRLDKFLIVPNKFVKITKFNYINRLRFRIPHYFLYIFVPKLKRFLKRKLCKNK